MLPRELAGLTPTERLALLVERVLTLARPGGESLLLGLEGAPDATVFIYLCLSDGDLVRRLSEKRNAIDAPPPMQPNTIHHRAQMMVNAARSSSPRVERSTPYLSGIKRHHAHFSEGGGAGSPGARASPHSDSKSAGNSSPSVVPHRGDVMSIASVTGAVAVPSVSNSGAPTTPHTVPTSPATHLYDRDMDASSPKRGATRVSLLGGNGAGDNAGEGSSLGSGGSPSPQEKPRLQLPGLYSIHTMTLPRPITAAPGMPNGMARDRRQDDDSDDNNVSRKRKFGEMDGDGPSEDGEGGDARARSFNVAMMMEHGLLKPGDQLVFKRNRALTGTLQRDGRVEFKGIMYASVSAWIQENNVDEENGAKRRCTNVYRATELVSTGRTLDEIRRPMVEQERFN